MPPTRPKPSAASRSTIAWRLSTSKQTLRSPSSLDMASGDPGSWLGRMKLDSSSPVPPPGGRSMTISEREFGMPMTVSTNSPSMNILPSTSKPRPTKNAVTTSRSPPSCRRGRSAEYVTRVHPPVLVPSVQARLAAARLRRPVRDLQGCRVDGRTYDSQSGRGRDGKDGIDLSDRQPRPLSLAHSEQLLHVRDRSEPGDDGHGALLGRPDQANLGRR